MPLWTIGDASYKDYLAHLSEFNITWVVGHSEQAVADQLAAINVPAEDYFIWLTRGREGGEKPESPV